MKVCVAQFAKSPESDRVKTRMVPPLSVSQATALHKKLVRHVAAQMASIDVVEHVLWSTRGGEFIERLCQDLPRCRHRVQRGGDLGERLAYAAKQTLGKYDAVILIGSDCPYLTVQHIRQAVDSLAASAVVIAPADDGGYVLLGLRTFRREVFTNIAWGTSRVYEQTRQILRRLDLDVVVMPVLADIDRPEDLNRLAADAELARLLP